ncbi:hypothetical protein IWT5_00110 [Secundilactobacillus silagincola]|uniref:Uncharacterized protein n=1 Tax=Secundilactobacillus silagincola TaxID=1714681 RepID=A0A1Z5J021_9LACO|nr:hypothetical protein [Secundilactobacillus silagincola]GAX07377.1 hypothetical protein IWT5_00110 [Secundilactobacillus silagincola]
MTVQLKSAKPSRQMYLKSESHPQLHYKYVLGSTTKVKHPLVEPQEQASVETRTGKKKKRSWWVTIGTGYLFLKLGIWVWPYIESWVIALGMLFFMLLGLFLLYLFCVWLDNKTGGGGGYSGDPYDDSYDAGWFDSWAFHNDDHNDDNLY